MLDDPFIIYGAFKFECHSNLWDKYSYAEWVRILINQDWLQIIVKANNVLLYHSDWFAEALLMEFKYISELWAYKSEGCRGLYYNQLKSTISLDNSFSVQCEV